MMNTNYDLVRLLMELPESQRAAIARELLLSLEGEEFDADWEEAWSGEIEQRLARVEQGRFSARPWREALEAIKQSLPQRSSS
jgi:hypothetical protein